MGEIGNYTEKGVKYIVSNSVTLNSWYWLTGTAITKWSIATLPEVTSSW